MEDFDNQWQLFPHGKLVYSWDPYKLLRSNLEHIYDDSFLWVATKNVTAPKSSQCQSISIGRTHFIVKGTRYDLDYFGNDMDDLHNHLVEHMNHISQRSVHDGVYMYLVVHPNINKDMVSNLIKHIPGMEFTGSHLKVYVLEFSWSTSKL